jgi:PAS domain S-box-containing protein
MDNNTSKPNLTTDTINDIQFSDVLNLEEIQSLQDLFSDVSGVASLLTHPDGTPITNPSNYCKLCNNIIRKTDKGLANCCTSNADFGLPDSIGPVIKPCLSGGLWNACASIQVGGKHIANWLIGQVRNAELDEQYILKYADEIKVNREDFMEAFNEVPFLSIEQFRKVTDLLIVLAKELSEKANNNLQIKTQKTEQDKVAALLKDSDERYRKLFDHSTDAIFLVDIHTGKYLDANRAAEILTGKSLKELKRLKTQDITPNGATKRIERLLDENNQLDMGKVDYLRPDGTTRTAFLNAIPIGEDLVFGIAHDITDQKIAVEALRRSESLQGKIVANIVDVIIISDQNGINRFVSPNIEKMFGRRLDEVVGKSTRGNVHPDDLASAEKFISALLSKPNAVGKIELRYRRKDGSYIWIEFTGVNLFHDPDIQGLFGVFHDINEHKIEEQELIKAKDKAEESDRLKSAFLANMSHEIRTPMNGILGFADLLKEQDLSEEEHLHYVSIIEKSGARMLNIINDLIDISKVEAGQMEISISETNINEQIQYIHTFFKPEVESKGMQIYFHNGLSSKEAVINTDREKVYAILINLVKNAIKYSDKGIIEFGYNLKPVSTVSGPAELLYYVKDTGLGVPKEKVGTIFDRFIQVDINNKRAVQGAGLGLSITKAYVEMLGGRIWVESELGKGSTFYFTIPYKLYKKNEF